MSGEITLSGRILPVSGIREKLTAAQRAGVKTVILPEKNRTDVEGLPAHVLDGLTVLFANDVDGVIPLCLREEAS